MPPYVLNTHTSVFFSSLQSDQPGVSCVFTGSPSAHPPAPPLYLPQSFSLTYTPNQHWCYQEAHQGPIFPHSSLLFSHPLSALFQFADCSLGTLGLWSVSGTEIVECVGGRDGLCMAQLGLCGFTFRYVYVCVCEKEEAADIRVEQESSSHCCSVLIGLFQREKKSGRWESRQA